MFAGFTLSTIATGEVNLRVRQGGSGPPLLLIHGHPQTHAMWHKLAPRLAADFTVVAPDLRGYGGSSKPASSPDHMPYSMRANARDMHALMERLGFDSYFVAGHDRGARCAYRLALDHPESVRRLAVLDIIPTGDAFRKADMDFGLTFWMWFLLAQPAPLPERLIGADPDAFYLHLLDRAVDVADTEALADYLQHLRDPATIHAMCEGYRAAVTIDFPLDEADRGHRRIACPVLALWAREPLDRWYDVLAIWRDWAVDVRGRVLDCGHYLPEEAPDDVYAELRDFFRD
jgi:haloacetate dehalogenase